jgi:hypothetical protein
MGAASAPGPQGTPERRKGSLADVVDSLKQRKMEEMIKNELATFDLCVQGESLSSIIRCLK